MGVTLGLGWLIWSAIVWSNGQSPSKQLLGMKVLRLRTSQKAGWGTMFLREIPGKLIGSLAALFTVGILNFMLLWDKNHQQIWDKVAGTIVVNDPHKQLG